MGGRGDLSSIVGTASHRAKVRGWRSDVRTVEGFRPGSPMSGFSLRRKPLTAVRKVVWSGETERSGRFRIGVKSQFPWS